MRGCSVFAVVVTLLAAAGGCDKTSRPAAEDVVTAAVAAMGHAGSYELLSLDPTRATTRPAAGERFHGWRVLGRTTVGDPAARARLTDALRAGLRGDDALQATCFNPRHGVRVTDGDKTYELVICFECGNALAVESARGRSFSVSPSPQPVFDDVLSAAGVPLAKAPG